jgi:hypothetical protein
VGEEEGFLAPNVVAAGGPAPTFQQAVEMFATPPPTWDDVVKGVLTVDDAKPP